MTSTTVDHTDCPETSPSAARPPGGTARGGGAKTPRKVQWAVDDVTLGRCPSSRALDEHGLDPEAFENLTDALERHRSTSGHRIPRAAASMPSSSEVSSPGSPTLSPTHQVPGEIYIDPNERSGLPGTDVSQYSRSEATNVVRAHKRGLFGNLNFRRKQRERQEQLNHRHKRPYSSDSEDVEKVGQRNSQPQLGTGVLSTLLSLYDHQKSGTSTPSSRLSLEDRRPDLAGTLNVNSSTHIPADDSNRQLRTHGTDSPSSSGSKAPSTGTRTPTFWPESRRPQERNSAGVFGALIASTGNISGAAAPVQATLAPNLKHHGYHLSRYSLESNLPKTRKSHTKTLSRPRSAHFDAKSAPNVVSEDDYGVESTSSRQSSNGTPTVTDSGTKRRWSGVIKDMTNKGWGSAAATSSVGTPNSDREEWPPEESGHFIRSEKKRKRRKAEVYITRHVAKIIQRQEFILKFARTMMMFGGPSHRLQAQVQSTAKVLDVDLSCMYLPDVMLISFDDAATGTSNIKLIRQSAALDLNKLQLAYNLYWKVIHDEISVKEASEELDYLMCRKPLYNWWKLILIGGFCSTWICGVGFNGSFIDSLISFPMGALLVSVQLVSVRNELYSNVFEITIATLLSFLSAAFASTRLFCYSAVASASVVLILPGFIVLIGSLELSSRNIVSGAVRLCFACVYALFLGFGLAIGLETYQQLTGKVVYGADDYMCTKTHSGGSPWYQQTPSIWWAFLTVPMYSLFLSLRNQAPWNKKELPLLIVISCIGWVTNHFAATKFPNQSDISAAVGAFAVGFVSNIYGRFFRGNAFVIMITGILFQVPSGLGNGGLFTFVTNQTNGTSSNQSYLSGFQTALQLVSVAIGLTVGLGISLVVVHPIQSRRRAGGVFSL